MISLNKDFQKLKNKKNKNFIFLKYNILNKITIKYGFNEFDFDGNHKNTVYEVLKDLNNFNTDDVKICKVNLKIRNKKKINTLGFIKLIAYVNKNVLSFFDGLIVKYMYSHVKNFLNIKFEKIFKGNEFIQLNFKQCIKLNTNSILFDFEFYKKFTYLGLKKRKNYKSFWFPTIDDDFMGLKINIKSSFVLFLYSLIVNIILNLNKINLFIFKNKKNEKT